MSQTTPPPFDEPQPAGQPIPPAPLPSNPEGGHKEGVEAPVADPMIDPTVEMPPKTDKSGDPDEAPKDPEASPTPTTEPAPPKGQGRGKKAPKANEGSGNDGS